MITLDESFKAFIQVFVTVGIIMGIARFLGLELLAGIIIVTFIAIVLWKPGREVFAEWKTKP